MGLFSDKCGKCKTRVRKGAKFCPSCGEEAPKGLTTCGVCGVELRTGNKFCTNCGTDRSTAPNPELYKQRWARSADDFAVRIDTEQVDGWFTKPVVIEHGTRALLFQQGKLMGELEAGKYDMGGVLKRIPRLGLKTGASLVLMDAGDVTLDIDHTGLWSSDNFEFEASAQIVMRVKDMEQMFVNLFKSVGLLKLDAMRATLCDEVQMILEGTVRQYPAEQLFGNLELRNEIESNIRDYMSNTLARSGFELGQLRFINFGSDKIDQLREQRQDVAVAEAEGDITAQRVALAQRLRETMTQDRIHEFKDGNDFEQFVRQTEHEMGMKEVIRGDEMTRLSERMEFDRSRESILRRLEIQTITDEDRREREWKELLSQERVRDEQQSRELDRRIEQAKSDNEIEKLNIEKGRLRHAESIRQREENLGLRAKTHEQEMAEARDGVDMLKQVKDIEYEEDKRQQDLDIEAAKADQEVEAQRLEARSKATAEALLSIVGGADAGKQIAEIEQLRQQQNMSPEQILALAAQASPEAARALAKKYENEGQVQGALVEQMEKQLADQRSMSDGYADRMERLMQTALGQMGNVASTRAQVADSQQTVVVPGGGAGRPVVVNPPVASNCKHCGSDMDQGDQFCPECGKQQ